MLRSGELTGATVKIAIKVRNVDDGTGSSNDDSENQSDNDNQPQNFIKKTPTGVYSKKKVDDDINDNDNPKEDNKRN